MSIRYGKHVSKKSTPQTEPTSKRQVKNYAGGYVFETSKWDRLLRFLILGTDGGTFYAGERELTRANAEVVEACLEEIRSVRSIPLLKSAMEVSLRRTIRRFWPSRLQVRARIHSIERWLAALPAVCRIPTHLFHFLAFAEEMRGWGRGLRNAIGNWYERWNPDPTGLRAAQVPVS